MRLSRLRCVRVVVVALVVLGAGEMAGAADWPTFRKDVRRSGVSEETLAFPLQQAWVWQAKYAPRPAYGLGYPRVTNFEGGVEKRRIDFDRSDSVAVVGGKVFFGSVGDGMVRCVEAATGKAVWTFATEGPVRLAPTVYEGRVYVGSDDGWVYCLEAADGKVAWKFRAAPEDWRVVGNGSLVSLWPVRTGVMVDKGVAYFGAGIFASEGVFLYAVDAKTGKVIWKNDKEGQKKLGQVCPQGYWLATDDRIVVPMARLAPGVYDRKTGEFCDRLSIYFGGGTFGTLVGDLLFTGWEGAMVFRIGKGTLTQSQGNSQQAAGGFPGGQLVATASRVYSCALPHGAGTSSFVQAFSWTAPAGAGDAAKEARRGKETGPDRKELWQVPLPEPQSIILAGETVIVGSNDVVTAIDADGKTVWSAKVDGVAHSLAVSDGRLYVSTDKGGIYCFGAGAGISGTVGAIKEGLPSRRQSGGFGGEAEEILKLAPQAKKGFALVYGLETGELAVELARRTEMKVYAVDADPEKVAAAKKMAQDAGVYGGRVVVEQWPLEKVPFTKYLADLVVTETTSRDGKPLGNAGEAFRMTKPVRGVVVMGGKGAKAEELKAWAKGSELEKAKIVEKGGTWMVYARGRLEGARPWTHQYAGPGGTAGSDDALVRPPFRVQWWGEPGAENFVDRHYWGAAPLAYEGRMFVCSYKEVTAYDAYTGNVLWTYPLKNATRAHLADVPGNVAVGPEGYFVAVDETCYRLDRETGQLLGTYKVPAAADGKRRMWGYTALVDGVLVGSRTLGYAEMDSWRKTRDAGVFLCSDVLFGMDAKDGKVLWQYSAEWFRHNSVAIGEGLVFFSHPGGTDAEAAAAVKELEPYASQIPAPKTDKRGKKPAGKYFEQVSALELRTGKPRWEKVVDWTACGEGRGTLMVKDGLLLQMSDVGGAKAFGGYGLPAGSGRCVAAREAGTGKLAWYKDLNYRSRAIVAGDTIYAEPWAYDLKTGDQKMVAHAVTGKSAPWVFVRPYKHCGPFNGSLTTLFFRCEGFGYVDSSRDEGVATFDSNRPNCWMSFVLAEGLALMPTGDSGCRCGLAHQCSVALVHDEENRVFTDYTTTPQLTPVKHLGLNLGAPGDRRDEASGLLWWAYPRRKYAPSIDIPLKADFHEGGSFTRRDSTWNPVAGTNTPWLYTSGASGLRKLVIPVRAAADGPGSYTVKLHLMAPAGDAAGQRVFDVALQGAVVARGVDVVKQAGAAEKALVLTFEGVATGETLTIDLTSSQPKPTPEQWPILCGVSIETK